METYWDRRRREREEEKEKRKINEHVGIVIKRNDEYLFIKRALTKKSLPGIWTFPSGTIEEGEAPITTAIRETMEELNLKVTSAKILSDIKLEEGSVRLIFVLCNTIGYDFKADMEEIEIVKFMTLDDFFNKFKDEEIGHGLRMIRKNRRLLK